jgi:hypothetical protein
MTLYLVAENHCQMRLFREPILDGIHHLKQAFQRRSKVLCKWKLYDLHSSEQRVTN